jgi:hypothetical protein
VKVSQKILDFDIENRPLSYWYDGNPTAEITAIACSWVGKREVYTWFLGVDEPEHMLKGFRAFYDAADIVTGHYIRKHDLPIINGAFMELGMKPLSPKLTSDTKMDLRKRGGISMSQEALAAMYGLPEPKHHMTQTMWREANRLTPEGIEQTRRRVVDDVRQHKAVRARLIEDGWLGPEKWWKP